MHQTIILLIHETHVARKPSKLPVKDKNALIAFASMSLVYIDERGIVMVLHAYVLLEHSWMLNWFALFPEPILDIGRSIYCLATSVQKAEKI